MFKRLYNGLLTLVAPFHVIAKELTRIAELYEADLASRDKPVYRVTESPKSTDTEVFYTDGKYKQRSKLQSMYEGIEEPDGDE